MPAAEPVVVLENVNHHLGQGAMRKQILFDISTEIHQGEIVLVMGPSGSGKTTLLNLIGATRTVTDGSVRVLGSELRDAKPSDVTRMRRRLGFVFQHHHLLEALTACQNVQMGLGGMGVSRSENLRRSMTMLDKVGLKEHANSFPSQMSGGQCQRVAVARALVRESDLVLADEPTAALDKHTGREIVELLRRLARERGCTVIMVTHDPRILDVADRLMYLEDGRLSSFAAITSVHAVHLLTSLRPLAELGHLGPFLARMAMPDFVDLMRTVAAEAEQFLNVFDFGSLEETRRVFQSLMEACLEHVRGHLNARALRLWAKDGPDKLVCVGGPVSDPQQFPRLALAALTAVDARHDADSLCVPLHDRDSSVHAVLEIEGAASPSAVERSLRDFTRPFGLLAQISASTTATAGLRR